MTKPNRRHEHGCSCVVCEEIGRLQEEIEDLCVELELSQKGIDAIRRDQRKVLKSNDPLMGMIRILNNLKYFNCIP